MSDTMVTIDDFLLLRQVELKEFVARWKLNNQREPQAFPLTQDVEAWAADLSLFDGARYERNHPDEENPNGVTVECSLVSSDEVLADPYLRDLDASNARG